MNDEFESIANRGITIIETMPQSRLASRMLTQFLLMKGQLEEDPEAARTLFKLALSASRRAMDTESGFHIDNFNVGQAISFVELTQKKLGEPVNVDNLLQALHEYLVASEKGLKWPRLEDPIAEIVNVIFEESLRKGDIKSPTIVTKKLAASAPFSPVNYKLIFDALSHSAKEITTRQLALLRNRITTSIAN